MRFERDGIQREVSDAARDLLAGSWQFEQLRVVPSGGLPAPLWEQIAGLGWFELLVPEEAGGLGLGAVEAGAVFEEAGRYLLPGPLFDNVVAAPLARSRGLESSGRVSLAFEDPAGSTAVVADGLVTGTKTHVESADVADELLVAIRGSGGPALMSVPLPHGQVEVRALPTIDYASRPFEVVARGVQADASLEGPEAAALLDELVEWALVMTTSRMLGVIDRILELSVEYAQQREQFGRPIGTFQAVQQRLADMATLAIASRSTCSLAQWALATGAADAQHRARVAKAYVSRAGRRVAESGIQVHGGIGFSEEHDLHLLVKHALMLEQSWGGADEHEDTLAAQLIAASEAAVSDESRARARA